MEADSNVVAGVALFFALVSLVVAAVAFARSGGRRDVAALLSKQRLVLGDLSARARRGLEETLARVVRARLRLDELSDAVALNLRRSLDEGARELAVIERDAKEALQALHSGASSEARAVEDALARRIHHLEATIQVLGARAEIAAAERLADRGEFVQAERLLDDAVSAVREAQVQLRDELADESKFGPVLATLHDAVRLIRARAEDHKREIDSALIASDALVASLQST